MFNISHYSLLQSSITIPELVKKYKELEYKECTLIDYNTLAGSVQFLKECKNNEIKPILGCRIPIDNSYTIIIPTNLQGWYNLNLILAKSNKQLPLGIQFDELHELTDNLIFIGKGDYKKKLPAYYYYNEVAYYEPRYISPSDHILMQVLMAISQKSTIDECAKPGHPLSKYFNENIFYIKPKKELRQFGRERLINTRKIFDQVEEFDFCRPISLPQYDCPNGMNADDYLRNICIEGAKKKLGHLSAEDKRIYWNRVEKELDVFKGPGLSSYILIIRDILYYCKKNDWLTGCGRGSSVGSLVCYLSDITQIDPIKYDLIFERFYSKDRKGLPDIDIDVQSGKREQIIEYIRNKYGRDRVSHILTFNTLQGRSAVKEIFRVYGDVSFGEVNKITADIPDKTKISDELSEREDKSILKWMLEERPDSLAKWVRYENGEFKGEYADRFKIAVELESKKRSTGKHAGGVLICTEDVKNRGGLLYLSENEQIVGYEMDDCESIGYAKIDVLGLVTVDVIQGIQNLARQRIKNS